MITEINHFAITSIQYTPCFGGVTITVTTDTTCHLYMRWTNQLPLVHQDPYIRRGVAVGTTPRFCFDIYKDNEQFETGDTSIHTFYKPTWACCETRWFYFWGCKYGYLMPSDSCIFEYHNPYNNPQWLVAPGYGSPARWIATDNNWTVLQTKWPTVCAYTIGINPSLDSTPAPYGLSRAAYSYDTTLLPSNVYICQAYVDLYDSVTTWWLPGKGDFYICMVIGNNWDGTNNCSWYPEFNAWTDVACEYHVPLNKSESCSRYYLNDLGKLNLNAGGITRYIWMFKDDVYNTLPPPEVEGYYISISEPACQPNLYIQYCTQC